MEPLAQQPVEPTFNVIIPEPFTLERHSEADLNKIREEVMDKQRQWENVMSTSFFGEYDEAANSWRMLARRPYGKPKGLFNSKSGETNRATNTLASLWFRMLTANDPFFEAVAQGYGIDGQPISEEELFGVEALIVRQFQAFDYKRKLLKTLRSVALFGTAIVEEPYGKADGIEGTDLVFRSLLQTPFDPFVFDLDMSDWIGTIDYVSKYKLRQLSMASEETWNRTAIENAISTQENSLTSKKFNSEIYSRIQQRKQRAGYSDQAPDVLELYNYHGKLDTNNPVFDDYWTSSGIEGDPKDSDWTAGVLNGEEIARFHSTPFGTWHHLFKVAHKDEFELEPIAYGVGKIGKKSQRELDVTQSRLNDYLMAAVYGMFKIGKYAGIKASQLQIKPFQLIEMEDINQMEQLKTDLNVIAQALNMQGILKEDFRTTTGATTNLQAQITKATATEASLTQAEAIRGNSVSAEILAEPLVRGHVSTCHINNLQFLDDDIYVQITASDKPIVRPMSRRTLPVNVGFNVKVVTDKDFRPERLKNLIQVLNIATSVRSLLPTSINLLLPVLSEVVRDLGINPRHMRQPVPVVDQITMAIQKAGIRGGGGGGTALGNQMEGEAAGEAAGSGAHMENTPMGPVPTSPLPSSALVDGL